MKNLSRNKNKGLNLIELLLVLVVVAGIAVIAFLTFSKVQAGQTAASESQLLAGAQASAKALFPSGTYGGLDSEVANNANIFPDNMQVDAADPAGGIANQFNGVVDIFGTAGFDETGTAAAAGVRAPFFQVQYEDVPKDVCLKLAASVAVNWGGVYINGNEVKNTLDTDDTNDTAAAATIAAQCNAGATSDFILVSN